MPTGYSPAPAVQSIAEDLITKHHRHLMMVDLKYVFRSKGSKKGNKTCLGKARRMSGLNAFLSTGETDDDDAPVPFFVIEIAEDGWEELADGQRRALVDHELMHCGVEISEKDGSIKLNVIPHDLEAFRAEVKRHGLWQPDIANFVSSARQASFFETDESPEEIKKAWDEGEPGMTAAPSGIDSARAALDPSKMTISEAGVAGVNSELDAALDSEAKDALELTAEDLAKMRDAGEPTGVRMDMSPAAFAEAFENSTPAVVLDEPRADPETGEIPAMGMQDLADAINADPTLEAEISAEVLEEEYERLDSQTSQEEPMPEPKPKGDIADLSVVESERIDPEPIPAGALAEARPANNGGPKVIHFDPADVEDLQPPPPTERESLRPNKRRDPHLEAFLGEATR